MTTEIWVLIAIIGIGAFSYMMWYFPYQEAKDKSFEVREKGQIRKRIQMGGMTTPLVCFGKSCFQIMGDDHIPILTDGKGGKLFIPTANGKGESIFSAWVRDQELNVSFIVFDKSGQVITSIEGNEWVVNKSKAIDCNYRPDSYEVVSISEAGVVRPLLQVELRNDKVEFAFETYLSDGTNLFMGNQRIKFAKIGDPAVSNDLAPLFCYPSDKNFGKRRADNGSNCVE